MAARCPLSDFLGPSQPRPGPPVRADSGAPHGELSGPPPGRARSRAGGIPRGGRSRSLPLASAQQPLAPWVGRGVRRPREPGGVLQPERERGQIAEHRPSTPWATVRGRARWVDLISHVLPRGMRPGTLASTCRRRFKKGGGLPPPRAHVLREAARHRSVGHHERTL